MTTVLVRPRIVRESLSKKCRKKWRKEINKYRDDIRNQKQCHSGDDVLSRRINGVHGETT